MIKFFYENKGSISIFLLAIITAMLFFFFITFDISKINLASATARSNTDVLGNAVLADYDTLLKDAYGLFANSKDLDELSDNVTDYYIATMASNGIKVNNTNEIYAAISSLINDSDVSENNNMLQLKATEITMGDISKKNGVIVQPVNESAISNPVVMRRQIVEYMKYRAPVSLATGMLEKISVFKDIENQTEATTARIEYEDALNEVQNSSDIIYEIITAYRNNIEKISDNGYKKGNHIMYGCLNVHYGEISGLVTKYNGDGVKALINKYNDLVVAIEYMVPLRKAMIHGKLTEKVHDISVKGPYPKDLDNLISTVENTDNYKLLKQLYEERSNNGLFTSVDNYNGKIYKFLTDIQPLYDTGVFINEVTGDFAKFYRDFYTLYYAVIMYAEQLVEDDAMTEEQLERFKEVNDMLEWAFGTPDASFNNETLSNVSGGSIDKFIDKLYQNANEKLSEFNKCMYDVISTVYYQMLMSEYMCSDKSPLIDFREDIKDAVEKSNDWDKAIDNVETASYQASMRDTFELEAKNFNELNVDDVDNMKRMFERHFETYSSMYLTLIQTFSQVNGISLYSEEEGNKDTESFLPEKEFVAVQSNCDLLLENVGDLAQYRGNDFYEILDYIMVSDFPSLDLKCDGFVTDLEKEEYQNIFEVVKQISEKNIIATKSERNKLKEEGESNKKEADRQKKELEKEQNAQKEGSVGKEPDKNNEKEADSMNAATDIETFEEYIKTNATTKLDGGTVVSGDTGDLEADKEGNYDLGNTTDLLKQVGSLFSGIAETGRDNLYVAEYLTGSFSCLTTSLEDGTDTDKEKSITGLAFSSENNLYYRTELEYILYGCNSQFANKSAAIGTISAIRFALNLIYSYTDKDITTFTTATAAQIGAFIPFSMPVIKTVLHILLSAAESAWDMVELMKGNAVPLYKTKETWVCKASNIIKNAIDETVENTIKSTAKSLEKGISDYIDGTSKDITDWVDEMTKKKADEIKSMLNSEIVTPVNELVIMLVSEVDKTEADIANEVQVRIEKIIENLNNSKNGAADSGTILAEAYQSMIDYLEKNKSSVSANITELISKMGGAPEAFLNEFSTEFNKAVKDITDFIDNTVKSLNDEIRKLVSEAADEVKELAVDTVNTASDQLLSAVETKISGKLSGRNKNINLGTGSYGGSGMGSSLSNLLSMTYKDYLYVFLIIGMLDGTDAELQRAAQLMQCNINYKNKAEYEINKAVTMFNIYTGSQVKTSIIGRYADNHGLSLKNFSDGYYEIRIRGFAGY